MATIDGKWRLISASNLEAFHNAINTPSEFKAKALAMATAAEKDPTNHVEQQELNFDVSGGKFERLILVNGEKTWAMEYKIGVEYESSGPDGRTATVCNHLVNDSKITFRNKIGDVETTGSMEATGNELTLTLICNGVTAYQNFIRI